MRIFLLFSALLLACAIIQADTYMKIDANTVQVTPPSQIVNPDQLKSQMQMYQALIDRANAERAEFDGRTVANIAVWQAKIDEINNAAVQMGITFK